MAAKDARRFTHFFSFYEMQIIFYTLRYNIQIYLLRYKVNFWQSQKIFDISFEGIPLKLVLSENKTNAS